MDTSPKEPEVIEEDEENLPPPAPRINRFYPVQDRAREIGRWSIVVPNRADRRRANRG